MTRAAAVVLLSMLMHASPSRAQVDSAYVLTIDSAFALAERNSVTLRLSGQRVKISNDEVSIRKEAKLPAVNTGLNYGYISNSQVWSPDFSEHAKVHIPHQFTQFSISASQVVFKSRTLNLELQNAKYNQDVTAEMLNDTRLSVRFQVLEKYLEIYRLINQKKVFQSNLILAEARLKNILAMESRGMITHNDVLRAKLIVNTYQLEIRKIDSYLGVINESLNIMLGLPVNKRMIPDTSLTGIRRKIGSVEDFIDRAIRHHPVIKALDRNTAIFANNVRIIKGEQYPEFSLYAGTNLQRPFTNSMPAIDIYVNVWQVGVGLKYNISSVYRSRSRIRLAENIKIQFELTKELRTQEVETGVRSAFARFLLSNDELRSVQIDLDYATDNYRIVEKKYFNQLALQSELIDATNTRTEAGVKLINAEINVVYSYYQLLKAAGEL